MLCFLQLWPMILNFVFLEELLSGHSSGGQLLFLTLNCGFIFYCWWRQVIHFDISFTRFAIYLAWEYYASLFCISLHFSCRLTFELAYFKLPMITFGVDSRLFGNYLRCVEGEDDLSTICIASNLLHQLCLLWLGFMRSKHLREVLGSLNIFYLHRWSETRFCWGDEGLVKLRMTR